MGTPWGPYSSPRPLLILTSAGGAAAKDHLTPWLLDGRGVLNVSGWLEGKGRTFAPQMNICMKNPWILDAHIVAEWCGIRVDSELPWCFGNMLVVLRGSARAALGYVICFETAWLWLNGLSLSVFYACDTVGSVVWKNTICEPFWLALYLIQFWHSIIWIVKGKLLPCDKPESFVRTIHPRSMFWIVRSFERNNRPWCRFFFPELLPSPALPTAWIQHNLVTLTLTTSRCFVTFFPPFGRVWGSSRPNPPVLGGWMTTWHNGPLGRWFPLVIGETQKGQGLPLWFLVL